jgi:phage-related holin
MQTHHIIRAAGFGFVAALFLWGQWWMALAALVVYAVLTAGVEIIFAAVVFDFLHMSSGTYVGIYTLVSIVVVLLARAVRTRLRF